MISLHVDLSILSPASLASKCVDTRSRIHRARSSPPRPLALSPALEVSDGAGDDAREIHGDDAVTFATIEDCVIAVITRAWRSYVPSSSSSASSNSDAN